MAIALLCDDRPLPKIRNCFVIILGKGNKLCVWRGGRVGVDVILYDCIDLWYEVIIIRYILLCERTTDSRYVYNGYGSLYVCSGGCRIS